MRFGINLRGDLAKIDDAEIAFRFEELMSEREVLQQSVSKRRFTWPGAPSVLSPRGPLRATVFYKAQLVIFSLLAIFQGGGDVPNYRLYLLDCELQDVQDEIQRRVNERKLT